MMQGEITSEAGTKQAVQHPAEAAGISHNHTHGDDIGDEAHMRVVVIMSALFR